jgi:hypothetical protein
MFDVTSIKLSTILRGLLPAILTGEGRSRPLTESNMALDCKSEMLMTRVKVCQQKEDDLLEMLAAHLEWAIYAGAMSKIDTLSILLFLTENSFDIQWCEEIRSLINQKL